MRYEFPVGSRSMVVSSDNDQVRLTLEGVEGGHALLLTRRVDLERLSRLPLLAQQPPLIDFPEQALPAFLWVASGLHSFAGINGGGLVVLPVDDGTLGVPIDSVLQQVSLVGDFQALIDQPVDVEWALVQGVEDGDVRPDLQTAQEDIVHGRLVYGEALAGLGIADAASWAAIDLELGLISHRVTKQSQSLLRHPMFPIPMWPEDEESADGVLEELARCLVHQMYWYGGRENQRWTALHLARVIMHQACLIDQLAICPSCAQARYWLAEFGPEVMGDTEPRPTADELHALLERIDGALR